MTGVKISICNDGYKVSVPNLTVFNDYHLFVDAIKVLKNLSGGVVLHADGINEINCNSKFIDEYFECKRLTEFESILTTVKRTGRIVIMEGITIPIHIGPWILDKYNFLYTDNHSDYDIEEMLQYLSQTYWELANLKHANQHFIQSNDGKHQACLAEIELINGQVTPFDYLGACDFVMVHNHDTDDYFAMPI